MTNNLEFWLHFSYFVGALILMVAGWFGYRFAKKEKLAPHPDDY